MRILFILLVILLACNDKPVSEEQREAVREGIQRQTPVRITEEQILTKTFEEARYDLKDTIVNQYQWKTLYVKPADSVLAELWLAYQYGVEEKVKVTDNVQIEDTVVIYSKPVVKDDTLQSMLITIIPKKHIVLKLTDQ